jgi:L-serine/L-threonine ammonia-lyase
MNTRPLHIVSPLIESRPMERAGNARVLLKMEALQPTGSFKIRGLGFACQRLHESGSRRFVSSSGGNAGIAIAYAGRKLGMPVTVVVPESTGKRARRLIREQDADIVVVGQSWQEAHAHAQRLLDDATTYIHPFDDPLVWQGHASLIDESLADAPDFDTVVVSVGGGGLLCGIARGLRDAGRTDVKLVTAETLGANSFERSVRAGRPVTLDAITSVATSLGAKTVATAALDVVRDFDVDPRVVTDREAIDACLRFADDHRIVVEPACGAALALIYGHSDALAESRTVLVVVCGGAGVSYGDLVTLAETAA